MSHAVHVLLHCAVSLDGHLDDAGPARLLLSNAADLDRVDEVRSRCDAILVGAGTVRADDPRLVVRSEERRRARLARGQPAQPLKATLTRSGRLDPAGRFFTAGDGPKVVYCPAAAADGLRARLAGRAEVVAAGADEVDLSALLADLAGRGVRRLLVEGGADLGTRFLAAGLVDELCVAVAPFFVGDPAAPRFAGPAKFPHDKDNRMSLEHVERVGDMAVLTYRLRRPGEGP